MPTIEVSANQPDWTREQKRWLSWIPSRSLISCIRCYQRQKSSRFWIIRLLSKLIVIKYRFWSVVTGADIPLNCQIEGGLLLPHPTGIVIHPDARIGLNCQFFNKLPLAQVMA